MRHARAARTTRTARVVVLGLVAVAVATSAAAGAQPPKKTSAKKPAAKKPAAKAAKTAKPAAPVSFIVAPSGNEARYRVREQLVGVDLPNDAVGVTHDVTGRVLAFDDGRVVLDSSRIVVNVSALKSDKDRRDGFIKRRTLETDKFPTVELVPTGVRGFSGALPTNGSATFELLGDLTVHGVTRPSVWKVTAQNKAGDITGTASTAFTFKDMGLDQPRVPVVLSVADTIKLEYDFHFVRDTVKR